MGAGGVGTTQEYLMYRTRGVRFNPDIVAVLFILNDQGDNWNMDPAHPRRPYFVEDGDSLRLDTSFARTPLFRQRRSREWLKLHSSLVTLVLQVREKLLTRYRPTPEQAGLTLPKGWFTT